MIRTHLTDPQRHELQALRRTDLAAVVRDRLEMIFLSDAGWSAPRIASHLGCHPHTVRATLKGFRDRGTAALRPASPGPAPDQERRQQVAERLTDLLGQERTWTSRQLAEALQSHQITLSARQVRRYLGRLHAGYRRTAQTVAHKQDPAKVTRAKIVLDGLKKKRRRAA